MSNYLVYLRDDVEKVRPLGALTASSEDSVYTASNVKVLPVALPWRTAAGQLAGQSLRIDFPSAQLIDLVAVVAHNLTTNAVLYVNGGTSPDPDGSEFHRTLWPEPRTAWTRFDQQTFRYWKIGISDPSNSAGFLSIGRVMLGLSTQLTSGFQFEDLLTDDIFERTFRSEMGVPQIGEPLSEAIRFRCDFLDLPRDEADEIRWWLRALHGQRHPLFLIPNPSQQAAFFGRLISRVDRTGSRASEAFDSVPGVEFVEDHAGLVVTEPLFLAPNNDISEWDAGETLGHFERASTASYKDASLVLQFAAVDTPRIHYDSGGVSGLLLEGPRTNSYDYSEDLDAWVTADVNSFYSGASSTPNDTTGPDGSTLADKLVEDTSTGQHTVRLAAPDALADNTLQSISVFLKAAERTLANVVFLNKAGVSDAIDLNLATGAITNSPTLTVNLELEAYGSGWYRLKFSFDSASGGSSPIVDVRLMDAGSQVSYTGDGTSGLHVFGWQWEIDQSWVTSYIRSLGSPGTRAQELAWFTMNFPPQTISMYVRFIEVGQVYAQSATLGLAVLGNSSGARVQISQVAAIRTLHDNSSSDVSSVLSGVNSKGDVVEVIGVVNRDGSVQSRQRVNAGSPSLATQSATLALPPNWGAPGPLRLGYALSGAPTGALIQRLKLVKGVNQDFDSLAS